MSAGTIVVVLVIMAYSVGRQIAGEPLRVKRLVGLPAALTVIGVIDLVESKAPGPTRTDLVLIGAGCAINAAIGIGQGRLMRLESRDGYLWGQMPRSVLWWWAAKIASGVALDGIGHALGAGLAVTSAVMLLRLGINRVAQAAVVAPRAFATGIPFAPEPGESGAGRKDNSVPEENWQPGTNPFHDLSGPGIDRPGPSPTAQTGSPQTSLKRQIAQMLLREISTRVNDALK
jgi:hypothetical protein